MRFRIFSLTALFLTGCGDPCGNTVKAEIKSPDGKFVATAFIRNCGATTGYSPQVHLRPVGEPVAEGGNIFIGDHSDEIEIEWASPTQLIIYSNCEVIQHEKSHQGITIEKRPAK